jgi:NMD protein affecting ribosome stability and mRNA decay
MSEIDDDFDTCEPCQKCGRLAEEAGSALCDRCLEDFEPAPVYSNRVTSN